MKLDSTAATYGLIQVVFADVTELLATAVFVLKQRRNAPVPYFEQVYRPLKVKRLLFVIKWRKGRKVSFEQIITRNFKQLLEDIRDELEQLNGQETVMDDLCLIREACKNLGALSAWRNDRIHARVRQVDDGLALYGLKTGKRLSISDTECYEILQNLIGIKFTLERYLTDLIRSLDPDRELSAFLNEQLQKLEE